MKNKSVLIIILVFVLLMGGGYFLYTQLSDGFTSGQMSTVPSAPSQSQSTDASEETEPSKVLVPDFTVFDKEEKPVKLSDFRGKPVILNFWSSKCGPCKHEMPFFQDAFEAQGENIHFLMVNMTDGSWDTVKSATKFVEDQGYTFPVYYDTELQAAIAYGINSLPTTYFLDAEGYLVAYAKGAITAEMLQQGIDMIPK